MQARSPGLCPAKEAACTVALCGKVLRHLGEGLQWARKLQRSPALSRLQQQHTSGSTWILRHTVGSKRHACHLVSATHACAPGSRRDRRAAPLAPAPGAQRHRQLAQGGVMPSEALRHAVCHSPPLCSRCSSCWLLACVPTPAARVSPSPGRRTGSGSPTSWVGRPIAAQLGVSRQAGGN
jgi:hypothetical protein